MNLVASFLALSAIFFIVNFYESYVQQNNYYINGFEPNSQIFLLSFCSLVAGLCWLLHMVFLAIWLRFCGWRITRV
jgi:heme/copper-type cytochrome/quinol oxidase subunit 3